MPTVPWVPGGADVCQASIVPQTSSTHLINPGTRHTAYRGA
jgi:hypothetical protein